MQYHLKGYGGEYVIGSIKNSKLFNKLKNNDLDETVFQDNLIENDDIFHNYSIQVEDVIITNNYEDEIKFNSQSIVIETPKLIENKKNKGYLLISYQQKRLLADFELDYDEKEIKEGLFIFTTIDMDETFGDFHLIKDVYFFTKKDIDNIMKTFNIDKESISYYLFTVDNKQTKEFINKAEIEIIMSSGISFCNEFILKNKKLETIKES